MPRKRFSEQQIIGIIKEHEAGAKVAELCRRHGISSPTGGLRPALTAPARDGQEDKRPGRKDGSAGAEHGVIARRVSCALENIRRSTDPHVEA
jgi:hypothetical protein